MNYNKSFLIIALLAFMPMHASDAESKQNKAWELVEITDPESLNCMLVLSVQGRKEKQVEQLLKQGCNPSYRAPKGRFPHNPHAHKCLLEQALDSIDQCDLSIHQYRQAVQTFGPEVAAASFKQMTFLCTGAAQPTDKPAAQNIFRLLLQHKANPNDTTSRGETLLQNVVGKTESVGSEFALPHIRFEDQLRNVRLLLEHRADPNTLQHNSQYEVFMSGLSGLTLRKNRDNMVTFARLFIEHNVNPLAAIKFCCETSYGQGLGDSEKTALKEILSLLLQRANLQKCLEFRQTSREKKLLADCVTAERNRRAEEIRKELLAAQQICAGTDVAGKTCALIAEYAVDDASLPKQ